MKPSRAGALILPLLLAHSLTHAALRDTFPDTWAATDALGRTLPTHAEAGPPRPNRTVGIFYFLWLGPHSQQGGPWDISKILAQDPDAMLKPDSPLWGPLHAPHHWGESIFGYYDSGDPYVLRKHAQMLSDAGVDAVIFDVTNQHTYRSNYTALLNTWSQVRAEGARTPQVAFLTPFWDPAKVVTKLYRDLYQPQNHPDLWFRWQGKPLILADPEKLEAFASFTQRNQPAELLPGHTLGQSFTATNSFHAVGGSFPTWHATNSAMTLTLRRDGPAGPVILRQRFENVPDNAWLFLRPEEPQPPGAYYLEMSQPSGQIGWWSHTTSTSPGGQAFADSKQVPGTRNLRVAYANPEMDEIRQFFTFRRPQPDYFQGQIVPDMWSWLEVHPQHLYTNRAGIPEQMSVGVAQNAVSNRLGSMSEPGALGRNYHDGRHDTRPGAVSLGFNFAEQFNHALALDPRFIFITGWNEWIAGRFREFNGIRRPVMFVDQFDQEHSRDIEPMKGGHGDNYYYQMAAFIRRYKGVRPLPKTSASQTIRLTRGFAQWNAVLPEFRDDSGDIFHRDFLGYAGHTGYTNTAGRNDILEARVARDADSVYFYVRTREPLTPSSDPAWMQLLIDADSNHATGWEGYDLILNRQPPSNGQALLEQNQGGWSWRELAKIPLVQSGNQLHLAIPRRLIQNSRPALAFQFKWADHMPQNGDIVSWLHAGDTAPNARFNYIFQESEPKSD